MSLSRATARARMRAIKPALPSDPPIIRVFGEIDDAMASKIEAQMGRPLSGADMLVLIDSPGGLEAAARRIFGALRGHHGRVSTKALGQCSSAAIEVLLAGDSREARADCRFLLHNGEARPERDDGIRWTAEAHAEAARLMAKADAKLADLYAERTGKPARRFQMEMQDERGIDATQALGLGLIHRIL
jgi:ATP-dependent Clp protease protease subunit